MTDPHSETLSDPEYVRYSQHLLLEAVGESGQGKLKSARVLIVGLGGLGCAAAQYLVAAGVGQLWLADHDTLELSNLQRQVLYQSDGLRQSKAELARENLSQLNPHVELIAVNQKLKGALLDDCVQQVDLVLDCSDNLPTRLEVNRVCVARRVPLVSGAASGTQGQLLTLPMGAGHACYQCLYPDPQEQALNCRTAGVLGPLVGVVGSLQTAQAVKLIIGHGQQQANRLFRFDALSLGWQELSFAPQPDCPACGKEQASRSSALSQSYGSQL